MKYLRYLRYLLRHKWFVLVECWKHGLYWRGIKHDWSKFSPLEFVAYTNYFYGKKGSDISRGRDSTGYYKPTDTGDARFDFAWLHHQKWNDHHWQWWICPQDDGGFKTFEMSPEARLEMVCDWRGAGKAQGKVGANGEPEILTWYRKNRNKMILGPQTRAWVELYLGYEPPKPSEFGFPPPGEYPWPPEGAPEGFGNTTVAGPRNGKPDLDLAKKVGEILAGAADPTKRLKTAEVVVTYEDGNRQTVYQRDGHCRVVVEPDFGRVSFDTWGAAAPKET